MSSLVSEKYKFEWFIKMSIKEEGPSQLNDDGINLISLGMEWKNFMKDCLMKTEIVTNSVLDEDNKNTLSVNPNLVMDIRHAMIKNHNLAVIFPPPKELLRTNRMKLLREDRYRKLIQQKKERLIKNEIEKLKSALESYRKENAKEIEEITREKIKHEIRLLKFSKKYSKSLRHSELQVGNQNLAKDCNNFLKVTSLSEGSLNNLSSQPEEMAECFSEVMFHDRKGSIASFENDNRADKVEFCNLLHHEGKYLIMQKFFDENYSKNELKARDIYVNQLQVDREEQIEICEIKVEGKKKSEGIKTINIPPDQDELRGQNIDSNKTSPENEKYNKSSGHNTEDEILRKKDEDTMREFSKRHLEKTWIAWKDFTRARVKRKNEKKEFENKIENFFNKLDEMKNDRNNEIEKQNVEVTSDEMQQNLNSCNSVKNKLERKLKLISGKMNRKGVKTKNEELKALIEEVKASQKEAYQRLNEMEKQNGHSVERVKVMKSLLNVVDDSPVKIHPTPAFLLRMEKRSEERKHRWNEIQGKRKKLEEQKEYEKKLKKEQEMQAEEEEKRRKIEELRQKRIREKNKKERLLREKEKLTLQMEVAERYHKKTLLRRNFKLWSKTMAFRQFQDEKAEDFYQHKLLHYALTDWIINATESKKFKQSVADKVYEKNLTKLCFRIWIENCKETYKQLQVAVDWNDLRVTEKFFKYWLDFALQENLRFLQLKKMADLNYEKKLKIKFLNILRSYPDVKKHELEAEERKRFWRQKVLEILPDYCPVEIFE